MGIKMISLGDDILEKLKLESNASALISSLLRSHYSKLLKKPEDVIEEVKENIIKEDEFAKRQEIRLKAANDLRDSILKEIEDQNAKQTIHQRQEQRV